MRVNLEKQDPGGWQGGCHVAWPLLQASGVQVGGGGKDSGLSNSAPPPIKSQPFLSSLFAQRDSSNGEGVPQTEEVPQL